MDDKSVTKETKKSWEDIPNNEYISLDFENYQNTNFTMCQDNDIELLYRTHEYDVFRFHDF